MTGFLVALVILSLSKFTIASHEAICNCPLEPACGENEEIPACVPCTQTCSDVLHPKPLVCPRICRKTNLCYCKSGFVRGDDDMCIPEEECHTSPPEPICNCPLEPACGPNEEVPNCVPCAQTCSDILQPKGCAAVCQITSSCFCKSGFLKADNGTCIPQQQCPSAPSSQCGVNEDMFECPPCVQTCAQVGKAIACPLACSVPGRCYCKSGFVKNADGVCIPQTDCPVTHPIGGNCGANETLPNCIPCQQTCEDVVNETVCTAQCRQPNQCYCAEGFVRGDNGKCIPRKCCYTLRACS